MENLFILQSSSLSQWYVCNGSIDCYDILWIEYSEKDANDMKACMLLMGEDCLKYNEEEVDYV